MVDWLEPIILKAEIYFPSPKELNDPEEARPTLVRKVPPERLISTLYNTAPMASHTATEHLTYITKAVQKFGVEELLKISERRLHEEFESSRIYSVSKRPSNLHLWEEYACDHSGYCLEFRCEDLFATAGEVRYVDGLEMDITDPEQVRAHFFFYKTPKYSAEDEVRLVRPRTDDPIVRFEPLTLLTRIFLGRRMSEADQSRIRTWAEQRDPPLEVTSASELTLG